MMHAKFTLRSLKDSYEMVRLRMLCNPEWHGHDNGLSSCKHLHNKV